MTLSNDFNSQSLVGARVFHGRESGFTLVEALVGLTILAVGLLGLTGLQFAGMRNNHEAYLRSQAILQAYDVVDRMRANRNDAVNGRYNLAMGVAPGTGLPALVLNDLTEWRASLLANLPEGNGSIAVNGRVVVIVVQWNESRDGSAARMQFRTQSQL